ncbi:hypothetical protein L596_022776 [Steinernema carpocapsae]|nr:hypothetical protein L596_022776 [Steinernema carpocapsae]
MKTFVLLFALLCVSDAFFFSQVGGCGCQPPPPPPPCNCAPPPSPLPPPVPCGGGCGAPLPPPPPPGPCGPVPTPGCYYNQPAPVVPAVPTSPIVNPDPAFVNQGGYARPPVVTDAVTGQQQALLPPPPPPQVPAVQVAPSTTVIEQQQTGYVVNPGQPMVNPAPNQGGYALAGGK